MVPPLLLKGGTVILHGPNDRIESKQLDVLVEDGKIKEVARDILARAGAETLDCTNKIISPGFVDTHHHVWQTLLCGRHADELLLDYMPSGNFQSFNHSPEDIFWAQLGGCLELIDSGVTTVLDYSHMNYSADNDYNAVSATVASGIRSIWCFEPTPRISSFSPLTFVDEFFPDYMHIAFDTLVKQTPWGNGRVQLGFAFDGWSAPKEYVMSFVDKVIAAGDKIKLWSVHYNVSPMTSKSFLPKQLEEWGLLSDERNFVFAHCCNMDEEDTAVFKRHRGHAWVSTTPSTELQMALGTPACFSNHPALNDMQSLCSLGIDCHSNNAGSIIQEMRIGLQAARGISNEEFWQKDRVPKKVHKSVQEAFNLGTIQGARTCKMEDEVGSIAAGKRADLVIFDGASPSMICAAQKDPVAAIVLHSNTADIETVIVDGVIRKKEGKLVQVELDERGTSIAGKASVTWKEIGKELIKRQAELQKKIDKIDMKDALDRVYQRFGIDVSKQVDKVNIVE